MKSKRMFKEEKSTVMYCVNIKTLAINVHENTRTNHGYDCVTSTYENFNTDNEFYSATEDNILFFKTKDEAFDFIKSQIGM